MKERKNSQPMSIRMDQNLFDRLTLFCNESGQSKTTAIERALSIYIDEYEKMMTRVKQAESITFEYKDSH